MSTCRFCQRRAPTSSRLTVSREDSGPTRARLSSPLDPSVAPHPAATSTRSCTRSLRSPCSSCAHQRPAVSRVALTKPSLVDLLVLFVSPSLFLERIWLGFDEGLEVVQVILPHPFAALHTRFDSRLLVAARHVNARAAAVASPASLLESKFCWRGEVKRTIHGVKRGSMTQVSVRKTELQISRSAASRA
eukprot:scaffold126814_cov57-Phaeocystis_antarctica.AAC.1